MKRFRFPLQPVAVLRAHREMCAQEAFGLAVQAYGKAESDFAAARQRVTQFERALFAARQQNFSASDQLQALAAYRQECLAENASEKSMLAAQAQMHQRRADYLEAHRNVEVVAKLEHKARAAHRLDCIREEQAGYDDFAGRRSGSRRSPLSVAVSVGGERSSVSAAPDPAPTDRRPPVGCNDNKHTAIPLSV